LHGEIKTNIYTMKKKMLLRDLPGRVLWHLPSRFLIADLLGRRYNLRCVLFHDIAERPSPFTEGLWVTLCKEDLEAKIRFLAKHYNPVGLDEVLARQVSKTLARRPVLVTFDDGYASAAEHAGPICSKYGIRPVFFVNASLVGNHDLGLENFVCFIGNTCGVKLLDRVARQVFKCTHGELSSLEQVMSTFLPTLNLSGRERFRAQLADASGICSRELARKAQLYVTGNQLRSLTSSGFEIGSHTYSHVHCRALSGRDFAQEIDRNKHALEAVVGRRVRSFSVPYGSAADLGEELVAHLKESGHEAAFLVESRANTSKTDLYHLNRVSVRAGSDAQFFGELEILPRVRSIKDRLLA